MHDPRLVRRREALEELEDDLGGGGRLEGALGPQPRREILAREELHHHVVRPIGHGAQVEHLDDVVRSDPAGGLRLALEARANVCGEVRSGAEDLDRDAFQSPRILAFENDPPPAFADDAQKPILAVDQIADAHVCARGHPAMSVPRARGTRQSPIWASREFWHTSGIHSE